ncbi:MAG: hypothetical protein L6Q38_12860, partial [Nitrospira sp.]|nr:hypothetical protein [Nitrospira sp.]
IDAWRALERLGLSKWTGVRPGTTYERDAMEVLTADPLNGRFAGWSRDCRQSFWREPAVRLEPVSGDVGVLARMMDYQGADLGPSMTTFTNALGGRVVVMGYYPWSQMHHLAKSSQMKAVCAWLSHGRLPVWVESFARIHVWSRQTQEDETSAVILNASLDPATRPTLRWAHPCRRVEWFGMDDSRKVLRVEGDGRDRVRLPDLDPWRAGLVVARA